VSQSISEFVKPEPRGDGDRYKLSEAIGKPLVVQVVAFEPGFAMPDGPVDVVRVNVAELQTGRVFRDVLWGNGSVVDALKLNIGKTVAVYPTTEKSKSGRDYILLESLDATMKAAAAQWLSANPAAFAPKMGTLPGVNVTGGWQQSAIPVMPAPSPAPPAPPIPTPAPSYPAPLPTAAARPVITESIAAAMRNAGLDTSVYQIVPG